MKESQSPATPDGRSVTDALWHNRIWLSLFVIILVGLILGLPGFGVLPAFALSLILALVCIKQNSFRDLGLGRPANWGKTLTAGLVWGGATGFIFLLVIDPTLERLTGEVIDVSQVDVRGKFVPYLIWLAIGWIVGGFIEEFTFRGMIITRVTTVFWPTSAGIIIALLVSSVPFGLAHGYQGLAGQISTGLTGLILGILFVSYRYNLWVPILAHGFNNTVGITLIYLDLDNELKSLLIG